MVKKIFVLLFDGFSDWEISYLTPEINKSDNFDLVYFSETHGLVTSMGGLQIKPAIALNDVNSEEIEMLILPGGEAWECGKAPAIENMVMKVFNGGKSIAAICGATTCLGRLGLLNELKHTSNALSYLKEFAPGFCGERMYQDSLAVTDRNIITANGIAPIEFAREIFKTIGLYSDEKIEQWFQLFRNGIWPE